MTLRFVDSFDHYGTADFTKKWSTGSPTAINSTHARFGAAGMNLTSGAIATKTLDSQATWIVGAAMRTTGYPGSTAQIMSLYDSGSPQLTVAFTNTGQIAVYRGNGGTALGVLLGTTTLPQLTLNVWAYIELKATIHDTVGAYEVRVGGSTVLSGLNVDTKNTANATANQVSLHGNVFLSVDDVYMCDSTGSTNNNFLGDVRVEALLPDGAGTTTQWTPSAGSNYQCVDDATPNSDTDYVSSSTANQIDTYNYSSLTPLTGTVYGVQTLLYARKDDAGTRSVAPVVRTSSTDYVGTSQSLSASYQYLTEIFEIDPNAAAAWTISTVNSAEFGQKLTA
jgi:hypothetical protein